MLKKNRNPYFHYALVIGSLVPVYLFFLTHVFFHWSVELHPYWCKVKNFWGTYQLGNHLTRFSKKKEEKPLPHVPCHVEKICLLFGTQSGTAERISKQFFGFLQQMVSCQLSCVDLGEVCFDEFIKTEETSLWVFCVATYGDGEPVDSARLFFKQLTQLSKHSVRFPQLRYAILGLGNRDYDKFNWAAKLLDKLLQKLKAQRICHVGYADERHDSEEDALVWFNTIFRPSLHDHLDTSRVLCLDTAWVTHDKKCKSSSSSQIYLHLDQYDQLIIQHSAFYSSSSSMEGRRTQTQFKPLSASVEFYFSCFSSPLVRSEELLQCATRAKTTSVKHLTFDLSKIVQVTDALGYFNFPNFTTTHLSPPVHYTPGAVLEVLTPNDEKEVQWWLDTLSSGDVSSDSLLYFHDDTATVTKIPFPNGVSLANILRYFCDLQGRVTRTFLEQLLFFLDDADERSFLSQLVCMDSRENFEYLITRPMLNIREVVCLFCTSLRFFTKTTSVDLITLLYIFPRKMFRSYSVSSALNQDKTELSLTVKLLIVQTSCQVAGYFASLDHITHKNQTFHAINKGDKKEIGSSQIVYEKTGEKDFSRNNTATQETMTRSKTFRGCTSNELCAPLPHQYPTLMRLTNPPFLTSWKDRGPILLVAAGTGIAPCRSIWRHVAYLDRTQSSTLHDDCTVSLIYGCTSPEVDFLYRNEIQQTWNLDSSLNVSIPRKRFPHAFFAFSREGKKQYIQNVLLDQAYHAVVKLLKHPSTLIYVCGSFPMGKEIFKTFCRLMSKKRIKNMKLKHQYIEDLW